MDWGVSNIFAALLVGSRPGKPDIVAEELYHDARKDRVRTEAEQIQYLMQLVGRTSATNRLRRPIYACEF